MRPHALSPVALVASLLALAPVPAIAQIPDRFENLEILPRDIPRDSLIQIMRGFTSALGVRCNHCHVARDSAGTERLDFRSEARPEKEQARFMMRMVADLNRQVLPQLPGRSDPPVRVECVTCHRGLSLPKTLETILAETVAEEGVAAAIQRYRKLREEEMPLGRYNFGEQTVNQLARRLGAQGKTAEAIALLEMNQEFYPRSSAIDLQIADLHRARGERDRAIVRYRMVLEKAPDNQAARRRLEELTGTAPPRR
ncbi:MAG TPA: c-type cytochrome [Longimicrobiaceae bacterium]|nr:c-type cytochrome [Longimicrobiaceae bacterium]